MIHHQLVPVHRHRVRRAVRRVPVVRHPVQAVHRHQVVQAPVVVRALYQAQVVAQVHLRVCHQAAHHQAVVLRVAV